MLRDPILSDRVGINRDVWNGIKNLLFSYAELCENDDVVVVYTLEVREPVSWVCLALEMIGVPYTTVVMRPLTDSGFLERLRAKVPKRRAIPGKLVTLVFEWETMSHNQVFREIFQGYQECQRRIVRCINTGPDIFSVGMRPDPKEISQKNANLLHYLQDARDIRIVTNSGTDLRVTLEPTTFDWISNRGISELGRMIVLPAGEIATFPLRIDGLLVADFAVNVNYKFDGDVRLREHPVMVEIRDNNIISFDCENNRIRNQLEAFFSMPNAKRVGELGFGTHPSVFEAVSDNSHLNERRKGVHIGFGQHNQEDEVAGYMAQVHVDLIAAGGTVLLQDAVKIDLNEVPNINAQHPQLLKSVDLFSPDVVPPDILPRDCCGLNE